MMTPLVVESRPEVGSSKNRIEGFDIISTPILTLFFSPPDNPFLVGFPIHVSLHFSIFNISISHNYSGTYNI